MPDITFNCQNCRQSISAPNEIIGHTVQCPTCNHTIIVKEALLSDAPVCSHEERVCSPCPFCGESILTVAKKCKHCGEWINRSNIDILDTGNTPQASDKRILPLLLLLLFLGFFGAHSFYANKNKYAYIYLSLTALLIFLNIASEITENLIFVVPLIIGILGVCLLVDFIHVVTGKYTDSYNHQISKWI